MNDRPSARLGRTLGLIGMRGPQPTLGGATLGIFTPFAALEPDQPQSERTMVSLVSKLNRDDALLMCGFLNCVTSGSGPTEDLERQRNAYSALFTPDDAAKIDAFIAEHRAANRITLFFRGQLLELMRWVARYANADPGDGQTFSSLETRRLFVRAAFLAADLWAKRTFADKLTGAGTQEQALNRALGALRKGVEEAGTALHIGVALARGKALFEDHMPARLPSFPADFQAATGLTVDEYIVSASMLMMKVLDKPTDGYFFRPTYASQTTFNDKFNGFLTAATQDAASLAHGLWDDFDKAGFRSLRERPVLLTSSGQCVVLDPTFFIDYFTVSPMFKVLCGSRPDKEVFAAFGGAFEDYAISILQRIYPERPLLAKRLYTDVLHRKVNPAFQVDALVNDATELVVMEMKAAFIREDALLSADPEVFLNELRKRYAVTGDPADREVGVAQLAKCIRAIIIDNWSEADIDQAQIKRIFPVLVVHDERMGSPGVGVFLNRIFTDLLGDVGSRVRIAPLTVMTIHDLENIESSHTFTLRELLAAYVARSSGGMVSVHNFMATDDAFKSKVRPSDALMRKSFELLGQMHRQLFPAAVEADVATERV